MTTYHVRQDGMGSHTEIRAALEVAQPGDTVRIHGGVYPESLDSYNVPIRGGTSWGTKLTIEPYRSERVVLQPAAQFVVRTAHTSSSYVEVRGLELDASYCSVDAVKLALSSTETAHHVRLVDCGIFGATHGQGVLISGSYRNELRHCRIYGNGVLGSNKLHGIYIACPDNLVSECDLWDNGGGYGIHVYDGSGLNLASRNRIEGNHVWGHSERSGILLSSGDRNVAYRNTCWGNSYGLVIYPGATNWVNEENALHGNRDGEMYVHPDAGGVKHRERV